VGLLGLFLVLSTVFSGEPLTIGASADWAEGRYKFAGGTQPWALGFAVLIVYLFVLLMGAKRVESKTPLPGLTRRFAAFWIDLLFAMFALGPIIGLAPMIVEWRRTGSFAWSFDRTSQAAGDVPLIILSFTLLIPGLLFYFAIPLVLRRPSPGACVAGYQVVADEGRAVSLRWALLRSLVGYFALCAGFIAPFAGRDKKAGKYWIDKVFHTRAVMLK
jgi:hypothetical protein